MPSSPSQAPGAPPRVAVDYIRGLFERHAEPVRPARLCVDNLSETEKRGLWRFIKRYRPTLARQVKAALEAPECQRLMGECQGRIAFTRRELIG